MNRFLMIGFGAALMFGPQMAFAQDGAAAGVATGAATGALVGGPVGAVIGAAAGGVAGGIADDQRPRFRTYVEGEHRRSYRWDGDLRAGAVLPESGVEYYEVPREYGVTRYRYTVIDGSPVLVDPATHRVIEVIR